MSMSLLRVSSADARRHPGQLLVALLAIAAGVAAFVAVQSAHDALAASLQAGVERLTSQADLQITGVGGVNEIQESVRNLPAVAGVQPVIEQVVDVDDRRQGGLLIVAVDLAGDHHREYGLERSNAEVEDTLVFIAQPDSIAITRDFAARAHLALGDTLRIRAGESVRPLVVRALISPRGFAEAYGGNVAIMDVYAAQMLFGRGRTFDRIDVTLVPGADSADARSQIARAIGAGYRVDAPERRAAELRRRTNAVISGFDFVALAAIALAVVLVAQVYLVAIQRRRRGIGILRAIGATPGQISAMFLLEAVALGVAGGSLGLLLGRLMAATSLQVVAGSLEASRGAVAGAAVLPAVLIAPSLIVGCVAALLGLFLPARAAGRMKPIDAIASGVFATTPMTIPVPTWAIGAAGLASAYVLGFRNFSQIRGVVPVATLTVMTAAILLASRCARYLAARVGRSLPRLASAAGAMAGDSLQIPRRTAMTAAVIIVSATFALGLGGYMLAMRASFDGWITNVMNADVYVRASAGWGPSKVHLPASLAPVIAAAPGVASVDAVRQETVEFQGRPATLMAVESPAYARRVRHRFVSGDNTAFSTLAWTAACIITDDFARAYGLRAGHRITFETPSGPRELAIAGIVAADRRTVIVDRATFVSLWQRGQDTGVDAFAITLAPGAAGPDVQRALRAQLAAHSPTIVTTRQAFVDEMHRVLELAFGIMRGVILLALSVAVISAALSQLAVAAERARDIAILKALGALPAQIRAAALLESLTLSAAALLLAIPLGDLLAWSLRVRVSDVVSGFQFDRVFPWLTLAALATMLPIAGAIVSWLPAWRLASRRVAEILSNE